MSQEQIKNLVSERQRITAQINNLNVTNQKLLSEIDMINQQVTFSKEEQLSLAIQRDKLSTDVLAIEQQIRFNKQQELNLASERKQIDSNIIKTNKDIELMTQQIANAKVQINVLNQQVQKSAAEVAVLKEKRRTEQAQTADTISGVPVTGVMGKQRELYQAQKDGFARKAEQDLAKIMSDSWATRRATDEGTLPSKGLTDVAIDRVLDKAMKSIGTAGTDGIS